ncbi:Uncharacterised protein [Mycobacteroides abscessus subsp. abscessus]|nr:Uncharacterised protein [Mycobacteroides abscessus subsp. abscessus]
MAVVVQVGHRRRSSGGTDRLVLDGPFRKAAQRGEAADRPGRLVGDIARTQFEDEQRRDGKHCQHNKIHPSVSH